MKKILIFALLTLSSCTYTISLAHTEGQAGNIADDAITPTTSVSPTVNIPAKGILP